DLVAQIHEGVEEHHPDEGQKTADAKQMPHGFKLLIAQVKWLLLAMNKGSPRGIIRGTKSMINQRK
ncbi:MAG: hypothetical protein KBE53_03070, partial [Chromatiaceae bacterium]|nr:hypothetical protein [Chromatiaceae bacterium]